MRRRADFEAHPSGALIGRICPVYLLGAFRFDSPLQKENKTEVAPPSLLRQLLFRLSSFPLKFLYRRGTGSFGRFKNGGFENFLLFKDLKNPPSSGKISLSGLKAKRRGPGGQGPCARRLIRSALKVLNYLYQCVFNSFNMHGVHYGDD